jgi:hypothetical protein
MRRQLPSIRNPHYPLAYRIFLSLKKPSHPWKASDLSFKLENHLLTCLINHGFIISKGKKEGKGGTPANLWAFEPPVVEQLRFIELRQGCTHIQKEDSLFGDVYCKRLKHRMSLQGCRECVRYREENHDQYPQAKLQRWGVTLPFL